MNKQVSAFLTGFIFCFILLTIFMVYWYADFSVCRERNTMLNEEIKYVFGQCEYIKEVCNKTMEGMIDD